MDVTETVREHNADASATEPRQVLDVVARGGLHHVQSGLLRGLAVAQGCGWDHFVGLGVEFRASCAQTNRVQIAIQ